MNLQSNAGSEVHLIEYRLEGGALSPFPLLRCRNVYVLPGIPALLQVGGWVGCYWAPRALALCAAGALVWAP